MSVTEARGRRRLVDRDEGFEGGGEGFAALEDAHVAVPVPFRLALFLDAGGSGGKRDVAVPQEPVLLTALLEDCAVELLSLRTRLPPWDPAVPAQPAEEELLLLGSVG